MKLRVPQHLDSTRSWNWSWNWFKTNKWQGILHRKSWPPLRKKTTPSPTFFLVHLSCYTYLIAHDDDSPGWDWGERNSMNWWPQSGEVFPKRESVRFFEGVLKCYETGVQSCWVGNNIWESWTSRKKCLKYETSGSFFGGDFSIRSKKKHPSPTSAA